MIGIEVVRQDPGLVKANIKRKFQLEKVKIVDKILEKDEAWRKLKGQADALRADRNKVSKEISEAKKNKKDVKVLLKKAKEIPEKIAGLESKAGKLQDEIQEMLVSIPNLLHKDVPAGKNDKDNKVREVIGKPPAIEKPKTHIELGEMNGWLDFQASSEISGNGFYVLKGDLALLNQALISYARDFMVKKGYEYVEPPLMIRSDVLKGVYTKAEIETMSYKIDGEDLYLIATSEHPMIGMFIGKMMNHTQLPVKQTAYSMCFRREIGSHGINEKGLWRTHQFNKQEMIVLCHPDDSWKYYEELLKLSKELFKSLEVPIRENESCAGDLSDLKARGSDLEIWRPVEKIYQEITSVTNMTDAQARLLGIKFVDKDNEKKFVHTLNNTAIATSRALVGIMENLQQKDGSVKIPKVLQQYMQGKKVIGGAGKK
ncbi:serine--tRNA ligase [Candidatus Pacearchaeota archaeon CG_4_9_14_0_2_um_filter_39_13]|nr:serine--tRNA ligase [Candidatus Pacearchaeota archaeon]OIO44383.1 MAG: serine--tRNA ligase [Candidatus Pacearchaeota archaeon CG1_02_39_14]PJC44604.1 MAG: serine--tRNA ligase [Candidatus Pacearchaeota archaeon CG_4_9_14_0_2_um_filter_39_13]